MKFNIDAMKEYQQDALAILNESSGLKWLCFEYWGHLVGCYFLEIAENLVFWKLSFLEASPFQISKITGSI